MKIRKHCVLPISRFAAGNLRPPTIMAAEFNYHNEYHQQQKFI